jgi:Domain of unknown function (DUF222)
VAPRRLGCPPASSRLTRIHTAARAGLDLKPDIARLAQAIYEAVKGRQPDPDDPGDGFEDRGVRLGTTLGGAGKLTGDLSAECATLLAKVFETFGKSAGKDDFRSPRQRNHDALEAALRLALGQPPRSARSARPQYRPARHRPPGVG